MHSWASVATGGILFVILISIVARADRLITTGYKQVSLKHEELERETVVRRESEQERDRLASTLDRDSLTGLFNRARFQDELYSELTKSKREEGGALVYLDLDHFKKVNDTPGHPAGDQVLVSLGSVLQETLRETDTLARLGGDEFALILPRVKRAEAEYITERLLREIRGHRTLINEESVGLAASAGIALMPMHGESTDELLAHADLAMYRAKTVRDTYCTFSPDEDTRKVLSQQRYWDEQIRRALDEERFELYVQPIVALSDDTQPRYEVLLRMRTGDGQVVLPGGFLEVAERSGIILSVDRWVIRRSVELLARLSQTGVEAVFHVNVSGKSAGEPALVTEIAEILTELQVPADSLVIEITETSAVSNVQSTSRFGRDLRRIGCHFALDDFGVGYSSFSQLKNLPVDYLKIDGSFVRNLGSSKQDVHLVRAMVELATGLDKRTVAEFVETKEAEDILRNLGVSFGRGFTSANQCLPRASLKPQQRRWPEGSS